MPGAWQVGPAFCSCSFRGESPPLTTFHPLEASIAKTERAYLKLILGGSGALIVFVVICVGGFRVYRHWQEGHLIRRAAAFLSGGDTRTASLNARRALQLNPQNVDAMRMIAEVAEKTGDRGALDWRKKVAELNPGSADDALALVRCALSLGDLPTAEKALASVAESARQKPDFQAASARFAETKKDFTAAETHWAKAAELAPNDASYRLQLALTRLALNDSAKRESGLAMLGKLRAEPKERAAATRALIIDAIAHHTDAQGYRALAKELAGYNDAPFSDRILYLEILRQQQDPAFEAYLNKLKEQVPANATNLSSLLSWMTRDRMSGQAIAFAKTLPPEALAKWPVPLALAEANAQGGDWPRLERLTKDGNWANYDFLRRAYLARAFRGEGNKLAATRELAAAQKEAGNNPQTLLTLTQTIADWGWQDDAVDLLWALTKNPETRMQALQKLYEHYTKSADTAGLYRTLSQYAEITPNDIIQNNLAQVSLLLGTDIEHACKIAGDLAAKNPANPFFRSTYAFALLCKGDSKGAVKVMDGLDSKELRDPSVATYYGLVLSGAGQKDKAREFLRRSSEATLLPEEKALVTKAENSLN